MLVNHPVIIDEIIRPSIVAISGERQQDPNQSNLSYCKLIRKRLLIG